MYFGLFQTGNYQVICNIFIKSTGSLLLLRKYRIVPLPITQLLVLHWCKFQTKGLKAIVMKRIKTFLSV